MARVSGERFYKTRCLLLRSPVVIYNQRFSEAQTDRGALLPLSAGSSLTRLPAVGPWPANLRFVTTGEVPLAPPDFFLSPRDESDKRPHEKLIFSASDTKAPTIFYHLHNSIDLIVGQFELGFHLRAQSYILTDIESTNVMDPNNHDVP